MESPRAFYIRLQDEAARREIASSTRHGWPITRPLDCHTVGDLMSAILSIDNDDDARRFFEGAVADIQWQIDHGLWQGHNDAITSAQSNIGWCYGEGMPPERVAMWRRVTGAVHPCHASPPFPPPS
jgi:hypothetical protein